MKSTLTRRGFLTGAGVAAATAATLGLTGCSPSAEPTIQAQDDKLAETGEVDWLGAEPDYSPEDCGSTVETEILVIGAAAAGSLAAFGAIENGTKVTVIDKNHTFHYGGSGCSFLNSQFQLDNGIEKYDPQLVAYQLINEFQNRADMSFWTTWAYRSGELLDRLIEKVCIPQDMPVQVSPNPLDHSIQLNGFYSTSVQLGDPTKDNFKPFLAGVHRYVEENGGEFVYNMRAEKLVRDESGAVTGVIASDADGNLVHYRASKGVVVCTGSYGHNKEMVSKFMAENVAPLFEEAIYNGYMDAEDIPTDTLDVGDGHKMLCWAGARMEGDTHPYNGWAMSGVVGSPYLQVNQMGYRFMNETASFLNSIQQVVEQPNPNGVYTWQIITEGDGEMINTAGVPAEILKPFLENGDVYLADTIEELAQSIDVDPAVFKATVDRYNELCETGFDEDFGKRAEYMIPVKTPPLRAIRVPYVVAVTCGGVICNKNMEVLDGNGAAIPGLYAAGNTVGRRFGWAYEGSHVGLTNAIALMQGYIAAESAAAR